METSGSDVSLEIAGQKADFKNVKSLNTIATLLTLFITLLVFYALYTHQQDTKDTGKEFVQAIREQTVAIRDGTSAQREQSCLLKFDQNERKSNSDFCKQVSGSR